MPHSNHIHALKHPPALLRKGAVSFTCPVGCFGAVANRDDIKAMSSDGARLITAASDNDKKAVKNFLKNGVDVNSR